MTNPGRFQGTICMVGLGYMGLPSACLMAKAGLKVVGFDLIAEKVAAINRGECPFSEAGMPELIGEAVRKHGFRARAEMTPSDVYVIAVPTPEKNHRCDLTAVLNATEAVAKVLKDGDLVILESTVKPRTCADQMRPILERSGKKFLLAHCPERAIPGNTLHELVNNDRIVGGLTPAATTLAKTIYSAFVKGEIFETDITTAECVKLMENSFRDVNIAFANELSNICQKIGIDVWEAIRLANRHPRVQILQPGPGVGGHCIAVDPWFLSEDVADAVLIPASRAVNDRRPTQVAARAAEELRARGGRTIGILGLAYKKNVDDCRESPAEHVIEALKKTGIAVLCHDPLAEAHDFPAERVTDVGDLQKRTDLLVLVTDHDVFRDIKFSKPVLDTRRCLSVHQFGDPSSLLRF